MWLVECPNDDQGLIRPVVTASGDVVWLCDSGGEVWLRPDAVDVEAPIVPRPPTWKITEGIDVTPGTTRWAERADLPLAWQRVEMHD